MSETQKVWIVAETDYDHYAIVGVFDSEDGADAERERCEIGQRVENEGKRRYSRSEHGYTVVGHTLNKSRAGFIVRKRKDGTTVETIFSATLDTSDAYEPTFEGRASTLERAAELAEIARNVEVPRAAR